MGKWNEELELKIQKLPESPGCYLMKDAQGTIIYVGKAVNLKNRVRSYFRETYHTPKVAAMISHIQDFDILLCDSNLEALCLECNLIKRHRPYYNILLKDDKHYPYLRVNLRENYPRLTLARRMEKDGAKYFGPYIGATAVKQVIDAVRDVFPLRTCKLALPLKSPRRPCVNYEIGRCLAPCAGKCTEAEYWDMLDGVLAFLGGEYKQVVERLKNDMNAAAEKMQYEKAAVYRDKIRDVQGLMERQIAIQTERAEQDILALAQDGLDAMVQLVYVRGGRMVGGDHFPLPREGSEDPGEVLAAFLTQYYEDGNLIPRHVLVQALPEEAHTPIISSPSSRASPSAPTKDRLALPISRFSRSPFRRDMGNSNSASMIRLRMGVTFAIFCGISAQASSMARPKAMMEATFSVPARRPRSCSPPSIRLGKIIPFLI